VTILCESNPNNTMSYYNSYFVRKEKQTKHAIREIKNMRNISFIFDSDLEPYGYR
jgi:hypothetical protein